MNKPSVCVIIPYFNHGKYIDEAVESILNQTYKDVEIIIVNDGSTDDFSIKKIKSLKYPKTRIYHQENKGVALARNFAISNTSSEYIVNLDADDYYESTFIEKGVEILNVNAKTGVVTCYIQHFGRHNEKSHPVGGGVENFLYKNNACGDAMFRRICWEKVGGFTESLEGYEDWEFWIKITKSGWKVDVIPEYLINYRLIDKNSRSQIDLDNRKNIMMQFFATHRDVYEKHFDQVLIGYLEEIKKSKIQKGKLEEKINSIYNSKSYKIGNKIVTALNLFKKRND